MPDQELIDAIATGDLITQVDAARSDYDLYKLSVPLATLFAARLAAARGANAAVLLAGGSTAAASTRVGEARERLGGLLRNAHAFLRSIPEEDAPAADVLQALETYGFERGNLGDLESPALPGKYPHPADDLARGAGWKQADRRRGWAAGGDRRQGREARPAAAGDRTGAASLLRGER